MFCLCMGPEFFYVKTETRLRLVRSALSSIQHLYSRQNIYVTFNFLNIFSKT